MVFVQEEFASAPNMVIDQQNQPIREASGLSPNTNQSPPSTNQQEQPQQEPFVTASIKNASSDYHDTTSDFCDEESIDRTFFQALPPGYRFCPTDIELIVYYLRKKIAKEVLPPHQIRHVNLYRHSPDKISEKCPPVGEKEWYFFTPRDRKYRNGSRPNRAAGSGYWKATGADKPIKYNGALFGFRKALVFYEGKPPKGVKSNWIMHEYRVNEPTRKKTCPADMRLDDFVLCRIYKKTDKSFKSRPRNDVPENIDQNDYPTFEENERYYQDNGYPSDMGNNIDLGGIDMELNATEASAGFVQPQFHTRCSEVPPMDTPLANHHRYFNSHFQTPQNYGAKPVVYRAPNSGENAFIPKYSKEGALDIKSGGIQESLWMKDCEYHYNLPPELDYANTMESLPDLENILDNTPPISSFEKINNPFDSPPVSKRS